MPKRVVIDAMVSENPFSAMQILEGVVDYGRRFGGFRVAACLAGGEAQVLQKLRTSAADGILARALTDEFVVRVRELGKPTVNLDYPDTEGILPTVCCDDAAVGRLAAEHLLSRGYSNFAYFGPWFSVSQRREEGFCAAADAGRARSIHRFCEAHRQRATWTQIHNPTLLRQWLSRMPLPLGVMTFNDQLASEVLEVCESMGLDVPEQVAIVGVDNTLLRCEFATTSITSVDLGGRRIGYAASEMLHNLINGVEPVNRVVQLSPHGVVTRRSTDAMVFDDLDMRAAMRFIREQFSDGIGVDDVIRHVNVSRSSLERKFKRVMGRSPGDEIHRVRIMEARRLLETTTMHLADIAAACGYNYLSNFSASFKSAMGEPPSEYRRKRTGRNASSDDTQRLPPA